jgi:hypothetical protein
MAPLYCQVAASANGAINYLEAKKSFCESGVRAANAAHRRGGKNSGE